MIGTSIGRLLPASLLQADLDAVRRHVVPTQRVPPPDVAEIRGVVVFEHEHGRSDVVVAGARMRASQSRHGRLPWAAARTEAFVIRPDMALP